MAIDCCNQPGLMPFEQAIETLLSKVSSVKETESVPIEKAIGRVLAESIASPINVPGYDNSAMDGYACRADDLTHTDSLTMVGKSFAGQPFSQALAKGECVRIMTGAVIPEGADCVVMQENTSQEGQASNGETIVFHSKPKIGAHIRRAGEDIAKNQIVLTNGRHLNPSDIGLLASLGLPTVTVFRKLKVAVFSTGDEIVKPGTPLQQGQIYDSNRFTTIGVLNKLPIDILDLDVLPDDPETIKHALTKADDWADLVMTSGGVSVGEADFIKPIVEDIGELQLWKIAIKPGKPFAYGKLQKAHFVGLPGNPVSSLVTLHQIAIPMIKKMLGLPDSKPKTFKATLQTPLKKRPGRLDFQRGKLTQNIDGDWLVESTGQQGSGILSSISQANCFIVLPQESSDMEKGAVVTVQPFDGLLS